MQVGQRLDALSRGVGERIGRLIRKQGRIVVPSDDRILELLNRFMFHKSCMLVEVFPGRTLSRWHFQDGEQAWLLTRDNARQHIRVQGGRLENLAFALEED